MSYIPDTTDMFLIKDYEDHQRELKYPVCPICDEHILDEYKLNVDGVPYHIDCFIDLHKEENILEDEY